MRRFCAWHDDEFFRFISKWIRGGILSSDSDSAIDFNGNWYRELKNMSGFGQSPSARKFACASASTWHDEEFIRFMPKLIRGGILSSDSDSATDFNRHRYSELENLSAFCKSPSARKFACAWHNLALIVSMEKGNKK